MMNWTLVWLAPGGTQDSEFVGFLIFRLLGKWSWLTQRPLIRLIHDRHDTDMMIPNSTSWFCQATSLIASVDPAS